MQLLNLSEYILLSSVILGVTRKLSATSLYSRLVMFMFFFLFKKLKEAYFAKSSYLQKGPLVLINSPLLENLKTGPLACCFQ